MRDSCPNHLQAFGGFVQKSSREEFFTEGNEGNGGASRCLIHGSFNDLKGLANGRLGNPSNWPTPRAIDSKPPHEAASRLLALRARRPAMRDACPNHLQAFGGFVQKIFKRRLSQNDRRRGSQSSFSITKPTSGHPNARTKSVALAFANRAAWFGSGSEMK